ncbi:MAG: PAS domain S-box protein [Planctomycetaceae bacterium]
MFAATIETSPTAMVMIGADGCIVFVNAESEKLFGYPRSELIGEHIELLVPEKFRSGHPELRSRYFESPAARRMGMGRELFGRCKSGAEVPIEVGLSPVRAGSELFALATIIDITERKKLAETQRKLNEELEERVATRTRELAHANESLRASEERFELAVAGSSDGLWDWDLGSGTVFFAKRFKELLGYSDDEITDDFREFESRLHPEDRDATFAAIRGHLDRREPYDVEYRLKTKRNEYRWFRARGQALWDSAGRPTRMAGSITDIHQQKLASRALEQSNHDLQQFAYSASHDLQTPLRGIANFAQFLEQEYSSKLDETGRDYISRIVAGAKRMQRLINDLLEYSRVESRAAPFVPCDLNEVVDDAILLLNASLEETGAIVTHDVLPVVPGDRAQLSRLFLNLIGNAVKYRGEQPPQVVVSATEVPGGFQLSVRDNGIGISGEHFEQIFEIFRRLHTQQAYPGTGIGLALCKRIVQRHHGSIWVESEVGVGSIFHFTLYGRIAT